MSAFPPAAAAPERVEDGLKFATLPNALSILRVALLPPILHLLHDPDPRSDAYAFVLLLVAGITDLMDGYLARRGGAVSPSGKVVDPAADKVLIGGVVLYLTFARDFPGWLVAALVVRDVALLLGAWFFYRRDRLVFAADWSGKLTTLTMGLLILAYVLGWRSLYPLLTVLATLALAASYGSYGRRALVQTTARRSRNRSRP
ncbi:MAG TPA: CDP-alcohol phosphatidyltransferase family protein [Gemmatimonadota bacterium]|nr:CDP-alcohol phosphatidyltransferase family protein [Gemmatimonadota bacterium]